MIEAVDARLVAAFLIGGFFVFLTGAVRWKLDYQRSVRGVLDAVATTTRRWTWIHSWMIAGLAVTLLGICGLTQLLIAADGPVYSSFGLLIFAAGALPWLTGVAWRLTVVPWAASQHATGKTIPADIEAWFGWFGHLHSMHLISAYLSWIALGAAVLETNLVAGWSGWLGVVLGSIGVAGYVACKGGPFAPPILAHLYTLILGLALLSRWG